MDSQPLPNCLSYFPLEQLLLYSEIGILGVLGGCGKRQIRIFDKAKSIERRRQVKTDTFAKRPLSGHPGPPEADKLHPGSRSPWHSWIPASAGMTEKGGF